MKQPLCVDLDGTLVKTDLLVEAVFQLVKELPWAVFLLPFWLLKGKAAFKQQVFSRVVLDAATLPYDQEFLAFLKAEKTAGRELVLTTASPRVIAEQVAMHLGIFDHVMATTSTMNLAGRHKAEALVKRYGARQFAYAGNASVDLKVWAESSEALVVGSEARSLRRRAEGVTRVAHVFDRKVSTTRLILKAIRVHQWAKNVLVFAPLLFAHRLSDLALLAKAGLAFASFSLVASSVYLVNDLLDLESDRRHSEKRRRPFASGDLPLHYGVILTPVLLGGGMVLAALLDWKFFGVLVGYYVITSAYSLHLKQVVLADVLILAFLYAWRVFAGAVATDIKLSHWFLAFFGFLFFSLALVKRCSELILTAKNNEAANKRRGYLVGDLNQLASFGSSSGYIAVLVLALYISSDMGTSSYKHPQVLWLVCPLLLYWISRMWLMAHRGLMASDPLVFSMKDPTSYAIVGAMCSIWALASGYLYL